MTSLNRSVQDAVECPEKKLIFELPIKDLETEISQFHVRSFALFRTNLFLTRSKARAVALQLAYCTSDQAVR